MVTKLPSDLLIFSASTLRKPAVHPDAGEGLAPRRLALRDLVLVVREDEVHPAAVDVEVRADR